MKEINIRTKIVLTDEQYETVKNYMVKINACGEDWELTEKQMKRLIAGEFIYGGLCEILGREEEITKELTQINSQIPKGFHFASGLGREWR